MAALFLWSNVSTIEVWGQYFFFQQLANHTLHHVLAKVDHIKHKNIN